MKTINNVMEFDKDLFKVEELYERVGLIVEEFDKIVPSEADPKYIEKYILELRNYLAEGDVSPSHIILQPDGKLEILFYPINVSMLNDRNFKTIAHELEVEFSFRDRLKVSIPENIISDCKPDLTQSEMYYLFIAGLTENTIDFTENILIEKLTPNNEDVIQIVVNN